jgi:endonuclease-3
VRTASPEAAARLTERIESELRDSYGIAEKPRLDPLDELILTILSQNTSDVNRDRAWANLQASYGGWDEVRAGGREALEHTIRSAGLAAQKSETILRVLEALGEEGAACVLCFSLGRPVMPVDTHVHRLAKRLGLVPPKASPEKAHEILNAIVAPDLRFSLHVQLIRHGRSTCRARRPECGRCAIAQLCPRIGVSGD